MNRHENVSPVGGARDGDVFVVVDAAGDAEPGEERDDGAAAEEHGDDDNDERRRQDHLARVRQRVPDRQRERDGAPAVTGRHSLQIMESISGLQIDKSGHQKDVDTIPSAYCQTFLKFANQHLFDGLFFTNSLQYTSADRNMSGHP